MMNLVLTIRKTQSPRHQEYIRQRDIVLHTPAVNLDRLIDGTLQYVRRHHLVRRDFGHHGLDAQRVNPPCGKKREQARLVDIHTGVRDALDIAAKSFDRLSKRVALARRTVGSSGRPAAPIAYLA